ncbi:hypothetical protein JTY60_02205 [symbiont of Argiope bruennichi]|uniref:hypothetical protein n=1 Tax=symbiont of Argiope bruennichi TaxID=2810479 RepID=UPI003DA3FC01
MIIFLIISVFLLIISFLYLIFWVLKIKFDKVKLQNFSHTLINLIFAIIVFTATLALTIYLSIKNHQSYESINYFRVSIFF